MQKQIYDHLKAQKKNCCYEKNPSSSFFYYSKQKFSGNLTLMEDFSKHVCHVTDMLENWAKWALKSFLFSIQGQNESKVLKLQFSNSSWQRLSHLHSVARVDSDILATWNLKNKICVIKLESVHCSKSDLN